jgi:hypothetical protein
MNVRRGMLTGDLLRAPNTEGPDASLPLFTTPEDPTRRR